MAKKKRNRSTSPIRDENILENNNNNNTDIDIDSNTDTDIDINLDTDFDTLYSDEKTKEIVGSLFDEYVGEGSTNYFADHSNSFLEESSEDEETLEESIARKRRRTVTPTKKSIVFRKKVRKSSVEEDYPEDDNDEVVSTENENIQEDSEDSNPLDKTIILPKLSNFFKKADKENEENDDDDIDEFFAGLKKDSIARAQSAAAKEQHIPAYEDEVEDYVEDEDERDVPKIVAEPSKPREIHIKDRDPEESHPFENLHIQRKHIQSEEPDESDEEEQIVEIGIGKIILCALLIISVFVITALAYKNHSYSKQLEEARAQITELQKSSSSTYETELEELKKQVSELTAENESLKTATGTVSDPHTAAVEILSEAQNEISTQAPADSNLSQQESAGNTYTVKSGDTFWKISQSVYGNGADFQKILDANGLNENSVLNEGQVLKIPN